MEFISNPWPWYVAGPILGLMVPLLLLLGNKRFGISGSLRHICAACLPAKIPFFQYQWKNEIWNIFFVLGIAFGGWLAAGPFSNPEAMSVAPATATALAELGIESNGTLMPASIFGLEQLFTSKGLLFFGLGGFLVGFGTRYGGGCTSGHAIFGLSTLQWPSLIATISFMAGGFIMTHILFPFLIKLM